MKRSFKIEVVEYPDAEKNSIMLCEVENYDGEGPMTWALMQAALIAMDRAYDDPSGITPHSSRSIPEEGARRSLRVVRDVPSIIMMQNTGQTEKVDIVDMENIDNPLDALNILMGQLAPRVATAVNTLMMIEAQRRGVR